MGLEKFSRSNEVLLGGTFMRQNNIIFDIDHDQVGVARASCNSDASQIVDEAEMITNPKGQRYVKDIS